MILKLIIMYKLQSDIIILCLIIIIHGLVDRTNMILVNSILIFYLIKFYWWLFTGKSTNFSIINENSESEKSGS